MEERIEQQRIPIKVYRTRDRITVAAPMPGLQPEDITAEVTADGRLILAGELRGVLKGIKDLLVDEWSIGGYQRAFDLPEPVDGETANVTYGNGVLVVAFAVAPVMRPARLTMETTSIDHGSYFGHAGRTVEQPAPSERAEG